MSSLGSQSSSTNGHPRARIPHRAWYPTVLELPQKNPRAFGCTQVILALSCCMDSQIRNIPLELHCVSSPNHLVVGSGGSTSSPLPLKAVSLVLDQQTFLQYSSTGGEWAG